MAQQPVNHGTTPGDGQGESLFSAFDKVNENDAELFGAKTEFCANFAALPAVGEVGKIYVTLDDDAMYRWTGTGYDDLGGIQFVANAAALPATGEALKVYVALDTGRLYYWVGSAYADLCGLQFDANGNIIANVNHRTGTLDSLLGIFGGSGEIAVATDIRALVRYNDVGVPIIYGQGGDLDYYSAFQTVGVAVAGGVATTLSLEGYDNGAAGNFDLANGLIKATNRARNGVQSMWQEAGALVEFSQPVASYGTYRNVLMQSYNGVGWTRLSQARMAPGQGGSTFVPLPPMPQNISNGALTPSLRLLVTHDSTESLNVLVHQFWVKTRMGKAL